MLQNYDKGRVWASLLMAELFGPRKRGRASWALPIMSELHGLTDYDRATWASRIITELLGLPNQGRAIKGHRSLLNCLNWLDWLKLPSCPAPATEQRDTSTSQAACTLQPLF